MERWKPRAARNQAKSRNNTPLTPSVRCLRRFTSTLTSGLFAWLASWAHTMRGASSIRGLRIVNVSEAWLEVSAWRCWKRQNGTRILGRVVNANIAEYLVPVCADVRGPGRGLCSRGRYGAEFTGQQRPGRAGTVRSGAGDRQRSLARNRKASPRTAHHAGQAARDVGDRYRS